MFKTFICDTDNLCCYHPECDKNLKYTETVSYSRAPFIKLFTKVLEMKTQFWTLYFCEGCMAKIYLEAKTELNPILMPFK